MGEVVRLNPKQAFDRWAATYDDEANPLLALEERSVRPLLGNLRGLLVVDAGCGTGRWMRIGSSAGARVVGFDFSREMLLRGAGARVEAELDRPPFRPSADLVICSLALSYAERPQTAFAALAELVRPGGTVVVSDFHPEAKRRGWRRSHDIPDHVVNLRAPATSWERSSRVEAKFEPEDRAAFGERSDLFEQVRGFPALAIEIWRKGL